MELAQEPAAKEEVESEVTGARKKSFALFEEEEDEEKLKQTLMKVRKGFEDRME